MKKAAYADRCRKEKHYNKSFFANKNDRKPFQVFIHEQHKQSWNVRNKDVHDGYAERLASIGCNRREIA